MTFLQNRGIVRYVSAADSQQERSVFYIGKKRGKEKMTFYQELQLSSVGSKQLIKNTTDKNRHRTGSRNRSAVFIKESNSE